MEYVYFTIQDLDKNTLIPFTANDGSRLEMHKSDYIYFKNSLFQEGLCLKILASVGIQNLKKKLIVLFNLTKMHIK